MAVPALSSLDLSSSGERLRGRRDARFAARGSAATPQSRFAHYLWKPLLRVGPLAFAAAVIGVLALAWLERDEGHITAETGSGYWLGIIGAGIMLLLVGYPLRKRLKAFRNFGRVANWFRLHMILGILGPAAIVLHSNFKLGSMNSRVALFTMLVVVFSGIIGRYLYAKVHKGLYGRQAAMSDILADIHLLKDQLGADFAGDRVIVTELERYAGRLDMPRSFASAILSAAGSGVGTRRSRRRIIREVKCYVASSAKHERWGGRERRQRVRAIDGHLKLYFAAVKKADRLAVFERLFGLWHHLHMPLFVLLVLTVVIHVVAVHLY